MSENRFILQEIGSFRKPDYLSNNFHKIFGTQEYFEKASKASLETLALFKKAGINNFGVGGEMFRWEMYEHFANSVENINFYGLVRSFDNRYYRKGSVTGEISRKSSLHKDEVEFLLKNTKQELKIPITGPYTMMDWSFNETYPGRRELANAFSQIIREEIKEIRSLWVKYRGDQKLQIQIDEPAATTHPSEMDIVVESVNRSFEGIGGLETSIHVCYSIDYGYLFNVIPDLKVEGYNLEFANRDSMAPGEGVDKRPGYADVKRFKEANDAVAKKRFLGLGVTDVHIDEIESEELITDRINTARKILDDDRILRINPDCGLRTRSIQVGYQKLLNMSEAVSKIEGNRND